MNHMKFMDRMRGHLAEWLGVQPAHIKGRVAVQLIDDHTGRVVHHQEGDNYVNTAQWEAFAKSIQKLPWIYGYQGATSTVSARAYDGRDPRSLPTLRLDHLGCWSDTTAENTADPHAYGEVVAWAHRWSQGSPTTRQGLVQPSLCVLTDTSVQFVWEWTTGNGNGTFQSVGWRRFSDLTTAGETPILDAAHLCNFYLSGFSDAVNTAGGASYASSTSQGSYPIARGWYESATGFLWFSGNKGTGTSLMRNPIAFDASGDYTLSSTSDQTGAAFAANIGMSNAAANAQFSLLRIGGTGDWVSVGRNTSTSRPRIMRATNAGSAVYDVSNPDTLTAESVYLDVTDDGTNLWAVGWVSTGTGTGTGFLKRINPATGATTATVSSVTGMPAYITTAPWSAIGGGYPVAVEWDVTNSWFWILDHLGRLYNVNSSGAWQGVLMAFSTGASATLTGIHTGRTGAGRGISDTDSYELEGVSTGSGVEPWSANEGVTLLNPTTYTVGSTGGGFIKADGNFWVRYVSAVTYNTVTALSYARFDKHPNFGSRTLLGAPVTKTNTQTMRVAYTMSFS